MIRSIIAASLAAAAVTVAASAADDVVIDVTGVDFADPAQVSAVYDKVVEASRSVCEEIYIKDAPFQINYFERQRMFAACVELTVADTVKAASLPALSELYASSAPVSSFAVASN
jgi:hypothetical protein